LPVSATTGAGARISSLVSSLAPRLRQPARGRLPLPNTRTPRGSRLPALPRRVAASALAQSGDAVEQTCATALGRYLGFLGHFCGGGRHVWTFFPCGHAVAAVSGGRLKARRLGGPAGFLTLAVKSNAGPAGDRAGPVVRTGHRGG